MNMESIINLSRNFKGLVVVDEAYIDFADSGSIITCLEEIPNLVILRTFSKAWGLAGVRLGMAIASEQIIAVLNKIKYPYNINLLTQRKVARMLRKIDRRNRWVATIKKEKTKLVEALGKLDHVRKIYPSDANFILVKFTNHKDVLKYLVSEKIVVRNRSTAFMCEGCLRITVGSKHENKLLIRKLQVFEKKNKFQPS